MPAYRTAIESVILPLISVIEVRHAELVFKYFKLVEELTAVKLSVNADDRRLADSLGLDQLVVDFLQSLFNLVSVGLIDG